MARTISRNRPPSQPRNDTESLCGYCGVVYYRSQLRRDRAGLLACARDYGGDIVTLSEANAQDGQRRPVQPPVDPGDYLSPDPPEPPPAFPWPDGVKPIS
jgi:hypothetical protein